MRSVWSLLLSLAIACAARAEEEVGRPLDASVGVGLEKVETLHKEGTLRYISAEAPSGTAFEMKVRAFYERPGRLRLEQMQGVVVADGTNLTVQGQMRNLVRYATAPQTNSPLSIPEVRVALDGYLPDLLALLGTDPANALRDALQKKKGLRLEDGDLHGVPCHIIRVKAADFGMEQLSAEMWIDKDFGLVRKMSADWSAAKSETNRMRLPFSGMELTFDVLTVNQPLPADAFTYTPPEGARRMASPNRLFLSHQHTEDPAQFGKPAPDFTLPLLDGSTFQLSAQTGKIVIIDFWATWCGPCVKALPEMKKLSDAYRGKDVVIVGVSSDRPTAEPAVRALVATQELTYAIGIDTNRTGKAFDVSGIPTLVVLDREGRIQFRHVGYDPELALKIGEVVETLLDGRTPAREAPLSEEEQAALAEERKAAQAMRQMSSRNALDTNRVQQVWKQEQAHLNGVERPRAAQIYLPPSTHSLLRGRELFVLDAATGRELHRIPVPAECLTPNAIGSGPSHVFVRTPAGGHAVFLQKHYEQNQVDGRASFQSKGVTLSALATDGTLLWRQESPTAYEDNLDTLPGADGNEQLLLSGWSGFRLVGADGETTWLQRLDHRARPRFSDLDGDGALELTLWDDGQLIRYQLLHYTPAPKGEE